MNILHITPGNALPENTSDTLTATTEALHSEAKFLEHDPNGWGITFIAMGVVMCALLLLSIVFKLTGRLNRTKLRVKAPAGPTVSSRDEEVAAAIAMALHQHSQEARDEEIVNITIQEISRRYSPWNSKIYGVMNNRLIRK